MKSLVTTTLAITLLTSPLAIANASNHTGGHEHGPATEAQAVAETTWTKGTVKKINTAQSKVTISHEPITNLDMPSMTMIFYVPDTTVLAKIKEGENKEFAFGDQLGRMVIEDVK